MADSVRTCNLLNVTRKLKCWVLVIMQDVWLKDEPLLEWHTTLSQLDSLGR